MAAWERAAYAKLNLTLDVLGRREDGYHDLRMVMQTVSLTDRLTIETGGEPGVRVRTDLAFLPADGGNLAAAADRRYWEATGRTPEGLTIRIDKRIPVCAGLAGGSSDAAAVLRWMSEYYGDGLSRAELAEIGQTVGSDVPYCVLGGTALAEGRGEVLTPLPALPACWFVLCKPPFPVSTPELFRAVDGAKLRCHPDTRGMLDALERQDLSGVAQRLYNVFEDVLPPRKRAAVAEIRSQLLEHGALGACMSGTGPTVFGMFRDEAGARQAERALRGQWPETWAVQNICP